MYVLAEVFPIASTRPASTNFSTFAFVRISFTCIFSANSCNDALWRVWRADKIRSELIGRDLVQLIFLAENFFPHFFFKLKIGKNLISWLCKNREEVRFPNFPNKCYRVMADHTWISGFPYFTAILLAMVFRVVPVKHMSRQLFWYLPRYMIYNRLISFSSSLMPAIICSKDGTVP